VVAETENVKPFERNPRKIPRSAIEKVGLSIEKNGWRQLMVVDRDGAIVVGTVRWLAARKRGWATVPVHVAADMTPEQVRAYRIMDNRSHEETGWDLERLKFEITELDAVNFDLTLTGFEPREIDQFLIKTDTASDDAANQAPAPPIQPVSRPGDHGTAI